MLTVMRRYFTLEEYHRLGDLGFFGEEERVELIRGEIIQMPTKKPPHSVCNTLLVQQLILLLGKQAIVRGQEPIILPGDSEPQPDVAIVRNQEDNYLSSHPHPEDILLLIEVADSTLKYDQETFNYRLKRIYLPNESVKLPGFAELSLALSSIL